MVTMDCQSLLTKNDIILLREYGADMEDMLCSKKYITARKTELKNRFKGTERNTMITVLVFTVPKVLKWLKNAASETGTTAMLIFTTWIWMV